jgi:CheY-like chemotaxis protein
MIIEICFIYEGRNMVNETRPKQRRITYVNYMKTKKDIQQNAIHKKRKTKILVIEDHDILQKMTQRLFNFLGCEVTLAGNGQEALRLFDFSYDLVFLDIGLPDISGLSVCQSIRQIEKKYSSRSTPLPIIAVTAFEKNLESECKKAGASDFFVKPVLLSQLKEILSKWNN